MRNAFADELTKLAALDEHIVLLSGDIGNKLFDQHKAAFPERFYNCGVAEANMASVAAGLAMCGLKPITYTITSFNTTRCLEQIRVDICYHNLPVIIVGVGAGLSYASLGATHHSCEDISFLRSIPNMTVTCPGDALELRAILRLAMKHPGPLYIRMGKKGDPVVYNEIPNITLGKGHTVLKGKDLCLISTGNMLHPTIQVAQQLKEAGFSAHVISMHTVKPLDSQLLQELYQNFETIVSIEEHSLIGGLSSAIAEWIADHQLSAKNFLRFGTKDEFPHLLGDQEYIRDLFGLNVHTITHAIKLHLEKKLTYAN